MKKNQLNRNHWWLVIIIVYRFSYNKKTKYKLVSWIQTKRMWAMAVVVPGQTRRIMMISVISSIGKMKNLQKVAARNYKYMMFQISDSVQAKATNRSSQQEWKWQITKITQTWHSWIPRSLITSHRSKTNTHRNNNIKTIQIQRLKRIFMTYNSIVGKFRSLNSVKPVKVLNQKTKEACVMSLFRVLSQVGRMITSNKRLFIIVRCSQMIQIRIRANL